MASAKIRRLEMMRDSGSLPQRSKVPEYLADSAKLGYKAVDMVDKYNQTIVNNLSLVEEHPDLFQVTPSYNEGNFIQNIVANKLRNPLERISIKNNLDQTKLMEASDILVDKGLNEDAINTFLTTDSSNKGAKAIDDGLSFIKSKMDQDIFNKLSTAGKSASDKLGKFSPVISVASAGKHLVEGDIKDAGHDALRAAYAPLATAGPMGWGVIAVNELWDFFS